MFDIDSFEIDRNYFDQLDESEPIDFDLNRNAAALDRIDRELQETGNE